MSLTGLVIGLLNCAIVAAVLTLVGLIVVWVAGIFDFAIPWAIQRVYLLIVLLVFIICVISLLAGAPMFHIVRIGDAHPWAEMPLAIAIFSISA